MRNAWSKIPDHCPAASGMLVKTNNPDPMEGIAEILPGSGLFAIGTTASSRADRRLIAYRVSVFF